MELVISITCFFIIIIIFSSFSFITIIIFFMFCFLYSSSRSSSTSFLCYNPIRVVDEECSKFLFRQVVGFLGRRIRTTQGLSIIRQGRISLTHFHARAKLEPQYSSTKSKTVYFINSFRRVRRWYTPCNKNQVPKTVSYVSVQLAS
jgi:hypothetical protein